MHERLSSFTVTLRDYHRSLVDVTWTHIGAVTLCDWFHWMHNNPVHRLLQSLCATGFIDYMLDKFVFIPMVTVTLCDWTLTPSVNVIGQDQEYRRSFVESHSVWLSSCRSWTFDWIVIVHWWNHSSSPATVYTTMILMMLTRCYHNMEQTIPHTNDDCSFSMLQYGTMIIIYIYFKHFLIFHWCHHTV